MNSLKTSEKFVSFNSTLANATPSIVNDYKKAKKTKILVVRTFITDGTPHLFKAADMAQDIIINFG